MYIAIKRIEISENNPTSSFSWINPKQSCQNPYIRSASHSKKLDESIVLWINMFHDIYYKDKNKKKMWWENCWTLQLENIEQSDEQQFGIHACFQSFIYL